MTVAKDRDNFVLLLPLFFFTFVELLHLLGRGEVLRDGGGGVTGGD